MRRRHVLRTAGGLALGAALSPLTSALSPLTPAWATEALTLEAVIDATDVRLGEDIVLRVTVRNPTRDAAVVPELRLADDALQVVVRGTDVPASTLARLHGEFVEDAGSLSFVRTATRTTVVPAGGRLVRTLRIPAIALGTLALSVSLARGDIEPLAAATVSTSVTVAGTGRRVLARVETSAEPFTIELDGRAAYASTAHMWSLLRSGFYAALPFHRAKPDAYLQTGDPVGDGSGTCGWYVPAEGSVTRLARGQVALARGAHVHSGSSQWFVSLATDDETAAAIAAAGVTPFGTVVEGLEAANALAAAVANLREGDAAPQIVGVKTAVR